MAIIGRGYPLLPHERSKIDNGHEAVMEPLMQYTLVVAKDVASLGQDFVAQWNADPACYAIAYADIDHSTKSIYEPGVTTALPMLKVAAEFDTATLYLLIKRTLQKTALSEPIEIIEVAKPNGARVLLIKCASSESVVVP
ncbi:hypothetical protein BH10CHL1_BH10CHL1_40870 [soil metagenome]